MYIYIYILYLRLHPISHVAAFQHVSGHHQRRRENQPGAGPRRRGVWSWAPEKRNGLAVDITWWYCRCVISTISSWYNHLIWSTCYNMMINIMMMLMMIYIYIHRIQSRWPRPLPKCACTVDGADFLNFDTRKGRDIHPPYFCGSRHLCQNVLPMCFRVAPSMQEGKGKEKGERGKEKEKRTVERERKRGKGAGKGKGKGEGDRRKGKGQGTGFFFGKP